MIEQKIALPKGGLKAYFTIGELVKKFNNQGKDYIIVGASHVVLKNHKKPKSLDYWFRCHNTIEGNKKNTCQAIQIVIDEIVETGLFLVEKRICPTSNKLCKALILVK